MHHAHIARSSGSQRDPVQPSHCRLRPATVRAALATLVCIASTAAIARAQSIVSSTFDASAEGWMVADVQYPIANPPHVVAGYSPDYWSTGGNPGGFIRETDASGNWFFFAAPTAFLGDKSAALGGTISLDISVNPSAGYGSDAPLLLLVGAGLTLYANTVPPGGTFTHFDVPILPTVWRVNDFTSGPPPTTAQLLAVLSSLDALYVSGDWISGYETASLDNVLVSGPCALVVYCTAGTTSNGCVPAIGWTGTPSTTAPSGFTISVANLEGEKTGLIFYGISGPAAIPWGVGTSYMCVAAPNQRTGTQNSGGTNGACDGTLALDWNDYVATNPGVLGAPFAPGQIVEAQAWFRDPPAPKTTNLSNALEFSVCP